MKKTLVILKPSAVQRGLIGEITHRFERKGLRLAGMKMMQLTEDLLNEHYAHLAGKPFFSRVKASMMASPVIVCCYEGVDAIQVVRSMTGATNGRVAVPGTIRGDYCVSSQENIIHTSDSPKTAIEEIEDSSNLKSYSNMTGQLSILFITLTNTNLPKIKTMW